MCVSDRAYFTYHDDPKLEFIYDRENESRVVPSYLLKNSENKLLNFEVDRKYHKDKIN